MTEIEDRESINGKKVEPMQTSQAEGTCSIKSKEEKCTGRFPRRISIRDCIIINRAEIVNGSLEEKERKRETKRWK